MNFRTLTFVGAAAILGGIRFFLAWSKRRGRPFFENETGKLGEWSWSRLLLASFLTLFAELAFIRWIAVEVRVFAYFKNLALLLCFVGFGLGCALAHRALRWSAGLAAFLGLAPRQNSSGGKERLGRVSKMGNRYLRKLLVVGAHAVLFHRKAHQDGLRVWAAKLMETKPFKLVAVAIANKLARIAFAVMRDGSLYGSAKAG